MKLTKDERFTVYCIMLAEVNRDFNNYIGLGFCFLVGNIFGDEDLLYDLTELYEKKPENSRAFWFKSYGWSSEINKVGWQKRIELLKQCINETN